jgi:hypothetical protein
MLSVLEVTPMKPVKARRPFFTPGPAPDPTYEFWLNVPANAFQREKIEEMWEKYEPFCPDTNFLEEARQAFHERTWEMRLACVLLDRGFRLVRPGATGPDICIDGSPRIWVEAIAVGPGKGPDRVPDRASRAFTDVDRGYRDDELPDVLWHGRPPSEESLILRCTAAIHEKAEAYARYRRDGIVKAGEPYIVAISLARIEHAFYHCQFDDIPVFLQALFRIGAEQIRLSSGPGEKDKLFRPDRPGVGKAAGTKIATDAFASARHPEISGVFGSCTDIMNELSEPGRNIMFVNNPRAEAPIAEGTFKFGMEFVATKDSGTSTATIERRDRRIPYSVSSRSPGAE